MVLWQYDFYRKRTNSWPFGILPNSFSGECCIWRFSSGPQSRPKNCEKQVKVHTIFALFACFLGRRFTTENVKITTRFRFAQVSRIVLNDFLRLSCRLKVVQKQNKLCLKVFLMHGFWAILAGFGGDLGRFGAILGGLSMVKRASLQKSSIKIQFKNMFMFQRPQGRPKY